MIMGADKQVGSLVSSRFEAEWNAKGLPTLAMILAHNWLVRDCHTLEDVCARHKICLVRESVHGARGFIRLLDAPIIGVHPDLGGPQFWECLGHELGHWLAHYRPSKGRLDGSRFLGESLAEEKLAQTHGLLFRHWCSKREEAI